MKRTSMWIVCLLLIAALSVSFSACTKKEASSGGKEDPAAWTPVPQITPEPGVTDPTADPSAPEATTAPSATATPEAAPEATKNPITIELRYDGVEVTQLTFQTSTVFQLQAVTSDGSTGGSWTSSDASAASVDENGVVTCWKIGTPKITYTLGDVSKSCMLNITEPTVHIYFGGVEKRDITLNNTWGFEIDLVAVVTPEGTPVTWTSDDPTVATVNENGHVTGKRMGTTTVHAKCGTADAACIIRIAAAPPAYIAPVPVTIDDGTPKVVIAWWGVPNYDFTISVGQKVQMEAQLYNVEGNPKVTWSIQDPDFASVDENGVVTGLRPTTEKNDPFHPYTILVATCGDLKCESVCRVKKAVPAE